MKSLEEGFIEAAYFALNNKRAVYHIYNSVNREELERYLNSIAEEVMRRMVEGLDAVGDVPDLDRELIIHFYKCGLSGMVMAWVGEGMKANPEQLIRKLGDLLEGSVSAAMEKGRQKVKAGKGKKMRGIREFIREEDGVGVVELILILVVLIGLVLIFKDQITGLVNDIFDTITKSAGKV